MLFYYPTSIVYEYRAIVVKKLFRFLSSTMYYEILYIIAE